MMSVMTGGFSLRLLHERPVPAREFASLSYKRRNSCVPPSSACNFCSLPDERADSKRLR
jgi:hypothetical protein